uniref:Uncharacterized protein n=1 Tax=Steinernema glaseri TaxID=37863 RepID=A0A1I7Y9S8_9BILA
MGRIKSDMRNLHGTSKRLLPTYLYQWLYRQHHGRTRLFEKLLITLSEQRPLQCGQASPDDSSWASATVFAHIPNIESDDQEQGSDEEEREEDEEQGFDDEEPMSLTPQNNESGEEEPVSFDPNVPSTSGISGRATAMSGNLRGTPPPYSAVAPVGHIPETPPPYSPRRRHTSIKKVRRSRERFADANLISKTAGPKQAEAESGSPKPSEV